MSEFEIGAATVRSVWEMNDRVSAATILPAVQRRCHRGRGAFASARMLRQKDGRDGSQHSRVAGRHGATSGPDRHLRRERQRAACLNAVDPHVDAIPGAVGRARCEAGGHRLRPVAPICMPITSAGTRACSMAGGFRRFRAPSTSSARRNSSIGISCF